METINIDLKNLNNKDIDLIVKTLRRGKVIVYPTDTIYGIGCDATNPSAVRRIYKIKKRDKKNPLLVLVKSYCMLHDICYVSAKQDKYIRSVWPPTTRDAQSPSYEHTNKPATFILKSRDALPKEVNGGQDSLAVRLPKNDFLITILKRLNRPLISTSLNLSGQPAIKDLSKINSLFKGNQPDLIIDAGIARKTKGSAIIDIRDINKVKLIRR
jgi:L-threonylcarbamoyladenylate synthase